MHAAAPRDPPPPGPAAGLLAPLPAGWTTPRTEAGWPPRGTGTEPMDAAQPGRHRAPRRRKRWRLPAAAVTLIPAGLWLSTVSGPAGLAVFAAGGAAAVCWAAR